MFSKEKDKDKWKNKEMGKKKNEINMNRKEVKWGC